MVLVFYVPYFIPLRASASASYVFGYNNRVGIIILLVTLAIGVFITGGSNFKFLARVEPNPVSVSILYYALTIVLFACLAMYSIAGRFDGFGESAYEIDRIRLVADGRTPYVDFEWPFGVLLLYAPLLISHVTGLNFVQSYYAFWAINCLVGVVCLFKLVNLIDYPTGRRSLIFITLLGALLGAILYMGTHYGFLRHVAPLLGVVIVSNALRPGGRKAQYRSVFLSNVFVAALLLLSPETAIALAFACGFMLLYAGSRSHDPMQLGAALLAVISFGSLFGIAYRIGALNTLLASGGGADSFPILLSPHIVLFFAATTLCACYLYKRLTEETIDDNTFALILFATPMLASALARCDPTHVLLNGLGIIVATLFYISKIIKLWQFASSMVVFVTIFNVTTFELYEPGLRRALMIDLSQSEVVKQQLPSLNRVQLAAKLEVLAATDFNATLSALYRDWHGDFIAPFGYTRSFGTYHSSQIDFGYYEGFENANTKAAVTHKIDEMKDAPQRAVLLPDDFDSQCSVDAIASRKAISILFMRPFNADFKNPVNIRGPLCDIRANYVMIDRPRQENFGFGLWTPRRATLPTAPSHSPGAL